MYNSPYIVINTENLLKTLNMGKLRKNYKNEVTFLGSWILLKKKN